MKKYIILLSASIITLYSCKKNDATTTTNTNPTSTEKKYPYFTVGNDTLGGIASYENNKLYSTVVELYPTMNGQGPFPPCAGQTNLNGGNHKNKFQLIKIIDTTKFNSTSSIVIHTGSLSNIFTSKGSYLMPTSNTYDPLGNKHGSCQALNSCGRPDDRYFNHETGSFLYGAVFINNDYYYIYTGTFELTTYNTPVKSTFRGKAYKGSGLNVNPILNPKEEYNFRRADFDTLNPVAISAKFYY